jgi:hypothetical protein
MRNIIAQRIATVTSVFIGNKLGGLFRCERLKPVQARRSENPEVRTHRIRSYRKENSNFYASINFTDLGRHNLSKAGWSWGWVSTVDSQGRVIWIFDAHRDNGKRFIVRSDEILSAFLELERITHELALSALLMMIFVEAGVGGSRLIE